MPIEPIDVRKRSILKAVVTDYVRTAEPVGSHTLIAHYDFGVRSATIRNEMAELSEMGYLQQPHTSAGRIPSDMGYRFYVDRLMEQMGLSVDEAVNAKSKLAPHRTEIDIILEQTCRILSGLARYTSVATRPSVTGAVVKHISVVSITSTKILAILVLDNGGVIHELIETDTKSSKLDPIKATNFLMGLLAGRSLASLDSTLVDSVPEEQRDQKDLLVKVLSFIRRELESADETDIHMEGAAYITKQPEFRDAERLSSILSVLEQRSALYRLFSLVYLGPEVTVIIGAENPLDEMHDCSFVGTKYRIGGRVAGTMGVVGPTRMDYRRAIAAVEFMVGNLEILLNELNVA